jgi:hypothetical protein
MQQRRAWDAVDDALQLLLCTSSQAGFEGLASSLPLQDGILPQASGKSACSKLQLRQRVLEVWRTRTLHLHGNDPGSGTTSSRDTPRASISSRASPGAPLPSGPAQAAMTAAATGGSSARSVSHSATCQQNQSLTSC